MDVVGGVLLEDGTECKILSGIDDHSRFCVSAGIMARATGRAVCGFFAQALERYGVPEEILTDNGKVFTNRFGMRPTEVLFDKICRENGITHRLTAPSSPTTTGKIERFHRTFREDFLGGQIFATLASPKKSSTPGSSSTTPSGVTRAWGEGPQPSASTSVTTLPPSSPPT